MDTQRFTGMVRPAGRGRLFIPFPPELGGDWPAALRHVGGSVGGHRIRATVESYQGERGIILTPLWLDGSGLDVGRPVEVVLTPEGPHREELAPDVVAALAADPTAAEFFDGLAQFYRKRYLRWVDATSRRPQVRVERIATMVSYLHDGVKQGPT